MIPYNLLLKPPLGTPLSKGHPLAKGLVGCWLMNEKGGTTVRDLTGNNITGTISGAVWQSGGVYHDETNAGDNINWGIIDWSNWSELSIVIGLRYIETIQTAEYTILANWSANKASINWRIEPATDTMELSLAEETDTVLTLNATDLALNNAGKQNIIALTFRGGDKLRAYVDGIESSVTVASAANMDANITSVNLTTFRSADYFNGYLDFIYMYNRALAVSEIAQLYREPFAMFKDPNEVAILGGFVSVAANPKGPLSHPLCGPFGGPVAA